jgi:hypothetical protein
VTGIMSSILQPGQRPGIELTTAGIRSRGGAVLALSAVPPVLRPALRAFVFGYASAVGPRLITLVLQRYSRKRKRRWSQEFENNTTLLESAVHIIRTGFDVQRFPTFCAVLAGGSTILLVRQPLFTPKVPSLVVFERLLSSPGL